MPGSAHHQEEEYYYRIEGRAYSVTIDADAERYGTSYDCNVRKFKVLKKTPKGAWVLDWGGAERPHLGGQRATFCLNGSGKRRAHENMELALESFIARKTRAISILQHRIIEAESLIRIAKRKYGNGKAF